MKTCRTCKLNKEEREYYRHPATRDGLFSECIQCIKIKRTRGELCESCGGKKSQGVCKICLRNAGMKRCHRCKNIKPLNEFWKDRSRNDGVKHSCKTCLQQDK